MDILMYVLLMLFAAVFNAAIMHFRWEEFPGPVQDFKGWKKARANREMTSVNDFHSYKEAAIEEQKHAKFLLHSLWWLVSTLLWPLAVVQWVIGLIYLIVGPVLKGIFAVIVNLPKIIESAKGV